MPGAGGGVAFFLLFLFCFRPFFFLAYAKLCAMIILNIQASSAGTVVYDILVFISLYIISLACILTPACIITLACIIILAFIFSVCLCSRRNRDPRSMMLEVVGMDQRPGSRQGVPDGHARGSQCQRSFRTNICIIFCTLLV